MRYVCDAPDGKTWFRIETEAEAADESQKMRHAVEKYFRQEKEKAVRSFAPASKLFIEQEIGRDAHVQRTMPLFLTLRNAEGEALVTAMLPPGGGEDRSFKPIVVGAANADPYAVHGEAIRDLGEHFSIDLGRARCYPYARG